MKRDRKYIESCLAEVLQWIEENDRLPDQKIDMGVWFSDLAESEMLAFVEHPRYASDYLNAHGSDVEAYQMVLIPIPREDVQDAFDELDDEDRAQAEVDERIGQLSEEAKQEFEKLQVQCLQKLQEFLDANCK